MTNSPKGRILCTEDDTDTRDLLTLVLTQAGFEVTCSKDAAECVSLVLRHKFDLLLLDNWMPGMSGVDVCKQVREFDQTTPILFCSGAAYDGDKQAALDAGAQGYLVKPVMPGVLIGKITGLLSLQGDTI